MHDAPVVVSEDLELHVAWALDQSLQVDAGIPEGGLSFVLGGLEELEEGRLVRRHAHPLPAPAGGRLDHDRETDPAREDKPALLLDFATLTGAARTALGPDLPPFYCNDEALAAELTQASSETADPIWRMPLWDAYEDGMDTPIADMKNTGDGGFAGSIYAALFLRRFVNAPAWAHFDVFAWAPKEKPARPQGGEAQALRACWKVIKQRFAAA
jgi:leucyl aminopeptidase